MSNEFDLSGLDVEQLASALSNIGDNPSPMRTAIEEELCERTRPITATPIHTRKNLFGGGFPFYPKGPPPTTAKQIKIERPSGFDNMIDLDSYKDLDYSGDSKPAPRTWVDELADHHKKF